MSVPLVVRIGDGPTRPARLEGGLATPLTLLDSATGRVLWSAGAAAAVVQNVENLDAPVTGSIAAIDTDADGVHDRFYVGDMNARLWRFDLQHGAPAAQWAEVRLFADFSNDDGRGFLAAPDVSLAAPAGARPWLHIVLGTAAPGNPAANNRLYVLRDGLDVEGAPDRNEPQTGPLRESDLVQVRAGLQGPKEEAESPADAQQPGWYVELGHGHVIVPALTADHRAALVVAAAVPRGGACEVFAHVVTLELLAVRILPATADGSWHHPLAAPVPAGATLTLEPPQGRFAPCSLAGQRVAACDVDTRARRTWWRREDAE